MEKKLQVRIIPRILVPDKTETVEGSLDERATTVREG